MFLQCPDQELLLEFVTIPKDISLSKKLAVSLHLKTCARCKEQASSVEKKWNSYIRPEPEITSSLIKVYSKLKQDETLILKGWKLEKPSRSHAPIVSSSWLFRGAVVAGLVVTFVFFTLAQTKSPRDSENLSASNQGANIPFAQVRVEEKNRVKVQYMKPELLQTVEFETSGR